MRKFSGYLLTCILALCTFVPVLTMVAPDTAEAQHVHNLPQRGRGQRTSTNSGSTWSSIRVTWLDPNSLRRFNGPRNWTRSIASHTANSQMTRNGVVTQERNLNFSYRFHN